MMQTEIQMMSNQGFTPEQEEMLREPLQASQIKERPGSKGMKLKYIKADTAIDTANRIFGYGQWGYRVVGREHCVIEDEKKGKIEYYTCDIELSVVGAAFPFPGDGMGIVTSPFTIEMHEKARKEATSDALKRALRHYGDQFGLCLYCEDDYVDDGQGVLVKVKDVKVKPNGQQPQKQVVDAPKTQAPKQLPQPVEQTPQRADDPVRARLNILYERAKALQLLSEASAKGFLTFAGSVLDTTITNPNDLTIPRLDALEAYIRSKDAA
jgi:hypothetical protein